MTKRCHHALETKDGYPDDIICRLCETIWHISECSKLPPSQFILLPLGVRHIVLEHQAERFNKENPDYYKEATNE